VGQIVANYFKIFFSDGKNFWLKTKKEGLRVWLQLKGVGRLPKKAPGPPSYKVADV